MSNVTRLIDAAAAGDPRAAADLLPLVYDELRKLAAARLAAEAPGHTLDATALVHEAYLRLVGGQRFDGCGHFFAAAAQAMRRILVDHARRRTAGKRGRQHQATLDSDAALASDPASEEVLAVDEALERLASLDPRQAQLVELRYFAGFSIEETAELMQISPATVKRDWAFARAWLQRELG